MDGRQIIQSPEAVDLAVPRGLDAQRVRRMFEDWFASLSPVTRQNYAQDLDCFARFIGAADRADGARRLCSGTNMDARELLLTFRTSLVERGQAPLTINRRLSCLRSLYRHVTGQPLVVKSLKAVRRRRQQRGNRAAILDALLAAARDQDGVKALRDVALLLTVGDSGLRRAECCSTRVQDLDLPARTIHVRAKGMAGERVPVDLSEDAASALRAYLDVRGPVMPDAPLFASADRAAKGSGGLTPDGVRVLLVSLCRRAGIPVVRPHDFRRLGARTLAANGADAETLRSWGRWADYSTPARYVGEVAEKAREGVDALARLRRPASGDFP